MTLSKNTARTFALAGLIASSLALAAPAVAAESEALPQGSIAVHGADLTNPRIVARLTRQVHRVAMNICVENQDGRLALRPDQRACYETAVKDGLTQIAQRQQLAQELRMGQRTVQLADTHTGVPAAQ